MFVTIINDCKSENDIGRLKTRYCLLFPNTNINFVGVDSSLGINATLEAAGNLIDVLDASEGKKGIIAVNVAPRGQINDGRNGSSFCYLKYKNTIVISTIKEYNLSLVKKLSLIDKIHILDIRKVLEYAQSYRLISKEIKNYIVGSQFRSFDFQPRVSRWLMDGLRIPSQTLSIEKIPDPPFCIWLIDSFGNAKTTLLPDDLIISRKTKNHVTYVRGSSRRVKILAHPRYLCAGFRKSYAIKTNLGTFRFYEGLKDVPYGETAIYVGSSGLGNKRFLEIATQNRAGSAARALNLKVGSKIKIL